MLIRSPRHTADDLVRWTLNERIDIAHAHRRKKQLAAMADTARDEIADFAANDCTLGVSWGKDSVVVAHLVSSMPMLTVRVRSVYFVHAPRDNPDCAMVRDAFLAQWSLPMYREQIVDPRQSGDTTSKAARYARWYLEGGLPARRITGVRAAESPTRALSAATHGVATNVTCRPILRWSTSDVFAYLAIHGLPVHPAYAQTMGWMLDRANLRVAPLGGEEGTGHGRAEWEARYYGDALRRIRARHAEDKEKARRSV